MANSLSSPITVRWRCIQHVSDLRSIESEWLALHTVCRGTPFDSPQWLLTWIDRFWQSQWRLSVLVGYNDDKLVVLAPLYINRSSSILSFKKLMPLGQGEPEDQEVLSEFQDVLVLPGYENTLAELAEQIELIEFDVFEWRYLTNKANALELIKSEPRLQKKCIGHRFVNSSNLNEGDPLSKSSKIKHQRMANKLKNYLVEFQWLEPSEPLWNTMKDFHQQRWNQKQKLGAFHHTNFNQFHSEDRIRKMSLMCVMKIDQQIAAIHYFMKSKDTLFFYQSGWNDAFEQYAPGFCLHMWGIQNNPADYYDMMFSQEKAGYKRRFINMPVADIFKLYMSKFSLRFIIIKLLNRLRFITKKSTSSIERVQG